MAEEATTHEHHDLQLLKSYRTRGDRRAYDEFVRRFTPFVRATARKYTGKGEELDDLVQVGMLGLVKAIEGFDFGRGGRFISYAGPTISGEIKRHFRDHLWAVHVPRSMQELQAKLTAEEERIERQGGTVTTALLAERLGVDEPDVRRAQVASRAFRAKSLDARIGEDGVDRPEAASLDGEYARVEDAAMLDEAMSTLSERERTVVRMRYAEGLLQREIAAKLSVSQMQISRLLARATRKMRQTLAPGASPLPS
ncbi:MAG: sigma-70 family RNA polymerase sigma factor [Patulibacter sp.]|nr:sigma-70 family RNA polymerase sigma factor [Patulibacter sp.]